MKCILIDKSNFEAFVSLQDDLVVSIPISSVNKDTLGSTINFPTTFSNHKFNTEDFT